MDTVYSIALITRGAGAFAYSYVGDAGLEPGAVVAVPFQHRLELGLVMELDAAPPAKALLPLVPVEIERWPGWGRLLLDLCEVSVSAPDELAGHLLFEGPRQSLRLRLELTENSGELGPLAGKLAASTQKLLVKQWEQLAAARSAGRANLIASIAGDPDSTKAPAAWKKHYQIDPYAASLLGLPAQRAWPGSFLAGYDGVDLRQLTAVKEPTGNEQIFGASNSTLRLDHVELPHDWELPRRWAQLASLTVRSTFATWQGLREHDGLRAELMGSLQAGERVLVLFPQAWLIDRLWPSLYPIASHVTRFRAEAGPGTGSQILRQLSFGSNVVLGGPGAWKLAAYHSFDRIIVIDPTHPQYTAERTPHLDPRLALLLCATKSEATKLDFINLGLDALSGNARMSQLQIHEPYDPAETTTQPGLHISREDTDPLPLELRRPDKRRLVYFNRLGSGRGLFCGECWTAVTCPRCGSKRIHFSPAHAAYSCPDCGLLERDLRCPSCHLMALVSVLPGLESVTRRPGDLILHGPVAEDRLPAQVESVIGTSQLLDPLPGFWPQQVIYVHAEGRVGLLADWPAAIDMAARLAALYDNPELESVHIVSGRLSEQLGNGAGAAKLAQQFGSEMELRELAGLPPYGTLFHLRATSARSAALNDARTHLGERLHKMPGTTLLRLGTSYRQGGAHRLGGWLINPQATLRQLQELRWELHRMDVTLTVHALRGPWVW